jgi:exopolysaccharide biosynthesis WecB/TagA/CpsF family protein
MPAEGKAEKPLSVAFYMHDFSGGGVERMRLVLFGALPSRGMTVSAIVQSRRGVLAGAVPASVPVIALCTQRTIADLLPLARLLRQQRFDCVLANLDHNNIVLLLASLISGHRTRIIIGQHNALSAEARGGWKYRLVPTLYRLLWRGADAVVAVSEGVAHDLAKTARIPRNAITVIYNPVVADDAAGRVLSMPPHPWLEGGSLPVFLFAGRLTAQKDPHTLLRAFAVVSRTLPSRLILLGEGELAAPLARLAAELGIGQSVHFAGFQPDPLRWIGHASALVLSSRHEGLGNVIIEALACGVPVIATDCPFGPAEILLRGRLGTLVPIGDPDAMAAAMLAYAGQAVTADERRARAADFSVQACVARHRDICDRVLSRPAGAKRIFGISVSALDARSCVARILAPSEQAGVQLLVTPNLNHVRLLRRRDFAGAYARAALVCVDGFPLLLYARCRGLRLAGRVTGCDIMHELAQSSGLDGQRLFLVVESAATAGAALAWAHARKLSARTEVAVAVQGLAQDPAAQRALADAIAAHGTTILVMTLGAPVSEVFVHRNRDRLPGCWALCVGQGLRVELGLVARAPQTWRSAGLEWAWRLAQEPRRLGLRYLLDALWFPAAVLRDLGLGQNSREDCEHV